MIEAFLITVIFALYILILLYLDSKYGRYYETDDFFMKDGTVQYTSSSETEKKND
jgi:hypothetical protein